MKKIGYIDKTLYKYILHKNSHSNKDNNNYEKTIRRFQEHENTLYDLVKNICDVNDQNIYTEKYLYTLIVFISDWQMNTE